MKRYSLDETIESFFATETDATRSACDDFASRLGGPSSPTAIQGACSYTLIATEPAQQIIQFRSLKEPFKLFDLAKKVHPEFVPGSRFHGSLGEKKPVQVWVMDRVPGRTLVEHQAGDGPVENTVRDLARFFAQAWSHPLVLEQPEMDEVFQDLRAKLVRLHNALPPRFGDVIHQALEDLPLLFEDLRLALTHEDLTGTNIIVDPVTGSINGIIDWCALIFPFGFSLFQMYWMIGKVHATGWVFDEGAEAAENMFWETFLELAPLKHDHVDKIQKSRIVGILLRTGYTWDPNLNDFRPIDEDRGAIDRFSFCQLDGWLNHVQQRGRL